VPSFKEEHDPGVDTSNAGSFETGDTYRRGHTLEATPSLGAKGFMRALYDFKFSTLIATRVIRFLYALVVILYSIAFAIGFFSLLGKGSAGVAAAIFLVPVYVLSIIWLRVLTEFFIVFFRMGDDVRSISLRGLSIDTTTTSIAPATAQLGAPPVVAAPTSRPAGWLDAPDDPSRLRYWDGQTWTEHYAPKGGATPAE
jgi:uncharacterized protein DUF4282/uncharacterized protein DUF2510